MELDMIRWHSIGRRLRVWLEVVRDFLSRGDTAGKSDTIATTDLLEYLTFFQCDIGGL